MTRFLIAIVLLAALAAAYFWAALHWSFSSGERAGWVQKLSNKGWVCKTWEGELAMVSMPGAAPEKFLFTIVDDDVAAQVTKVMGRRATLHYEEKVGPCPCPCPCPRPRPRHRRRGHRPRRQLQRRSEFTRSAMSAATANRQA